MTNASRRDREPTTAGRLARDASSSSVSLGLGHKAGETALLPLGIDDGRGLSPWVRPTSPVRGRRLVAEMGPVDRTENATIHLSQRGEHTSDFGAGFGEQYNDEWIEQDMQGIRPREAHGRLPAGWRKHSPQQRHRSGMILSVEHSGIPQHLDRFFE